MPRTRGQLYGKKEASKVSLLGASAHLSTLALKAAGALLLPLPAHLGGGLLEGGSVTHVE